MKPQQAPSCPHPALAERLQRNRISRRDSLWLFAAATAPVALGLSGCANSPVTGKKILVGMSASDERRLDLAQSPHQFSQDLGAVLEPGVNEYVAQLSQRLAPHTHRPDAPYSARVLNANYVNAYTFPAGSMGITRGIIVEMNSEAELAALLGHEMGHVNARHGAQRQGQAMVAQAALIGLAVSTSDSRWSPLLGLGAQIGASALLAGYSRDNEREADLLGQQYMVAAGYPAQGMTRLHELLLAEEKSKPSMLETMFSTHPMSRERRDNAEREAQTRFAASAGASPQRERYMDSTAPLRRIAPTIAACQQGETAMSRKQLPEAERQFSEALRRTPRDYAANLRMAQCQQALGKSNEAQRFALAAREIYPQEAQAAKLNASLQLAARRPERALGELQAYDRLLPGDPGVLFMKGVSFEAMGRQREAAEHYNAFLRQGAQGDAAQHARSRLAAWSTQR